MGLGLKALRAPGPPSGPCFLFLFFPARPPPLTPQAEHLPENQLRTALLVIKVFAELLEDELGMNMAPGHKMQFFQLPQPTGSYDAIGPG